MIKSIAKGNNLRKMKQAMTLWTLLLAGLICIWGCQAQPEDRVVYKGSDGPGKGKHIVLLAADDEYRSEESVPQLAKILAERHGFKCTVLFPINKETGEIDPPTRDNIPGLETLKKADLMLIFARSRTLPTEQMDLILEYVNSGKPIIGMRCATHAFRYRGESPYTKWGRGTEEYPGGFGRQVLGETWAGHYGEHQVESTRGLIAEGMENHPIVKGCENIWGPSDVYGISDAGLHGDCTPLVMGQVLSGMNPNDEPNPEKELVPIAWTKTYTGTQGKAARVFTTTMGHGYDLKSEGFRRLLVNACYWSVGMEDKIPARANVDIVGVYDPLDIGVKEHRKGVKPADLRL